ncbi:anaerobic ribonucleoside-triphosphate reductase activating protein [Candidatus Micrarchaeota archaeon]|nr:anaerobic ribonucleoside-triphosphate reductase activating protein [Candidatus Micrarchaeota archaeon]
MKIGGFQKTSLVDYPGRVSSIVFTSNCNMRCGYCYNADLACGRLPTITTESVLQQLMDRQKYIDAVVITGGEPTIWPDLPPFMERLKKSGFKVKLDTNGLMPERLGPILQSGLADYVAMDIKAPWAKYAQITGVPIDIEKLKQSVELIKFSGIDYEFRTTVAPGLTSEDLNKIAKQIAPAKRWFLQPFQTGPTLMDPNVLRLQWLKTEQIQTVANGCSNQFQTCQVRG